jgi:hypothetical protein
MNIKVFANENGFELTQKQKQKNLLLKISFTYFVPTAHSHWFSYSIYFNFSEIPEKIECNRLFNSIFDYDLQLFNSITINNIACVSKGFLTNLNQDTVGYIKEFIQLDLSILYNIFKINWFNGFGDLIEHEKKFLEKKLYVLDFKSKEYEYVSRAIKQIKRDERKFKKNKKYF